MKDQLLLLQKLQGMDARTQELRKAMESLPQKLRPAKQDLAKLEAILGQEKAQLADSESWQKEQEDLIRREEEALKQAKVKLQASKSAKDFAAASRELDNKRRSLSEREEEVIKVIDALAATRQNVEAHENDVNALREHIQAQEKEISAKVKALESEIVEASAGRSEIAVQIDKRTLKRYEQTQKRRGIALAPVVGGVCQGCHMNLPPQLSNILARFSSIETCPSCNRLLYRVELLEGDSSEATDE